jgi:hypothetical protein
MVPPVVLGQISAAMKSATVLLLDSSIIMWPLPVIP